MNYFDKEKLLSQNPTAPQDINRDIAEALSDCTHPLGISRCLKQHQAVLENDFDIFESVLDAYWYMGLYRSYLDGYILGHALLKQALQFIRLTQADIQAFIDQFGAFVDSVVANGGSSRENLMTFCHFSFDKQVVFSQQATIAILSQRVYSLVDKKRYIEAHHIAEKDFNSAQLHLSGCLDACLGVLLCDFEDEGFAAIKSLYEDNQSNVILAVLSYCYNKRDVPYDNVLEKIRQVNQQRIKANCDNAHQKTDYFAVTQLGAWVKYKANPLTNYKIALIGIDILEDMVSKPQVLAQQIPSSSSEHNAFENLFELIHYQFNKEKDSEAYQRLKHCLQILANSPNLSIKYRLEAMLVANEALNFWVDNHRQLIEEMKLFPTNSYQWGTSSARECRIDNADCFRCPIFKLDDVIACIDKPQFSYQALNYFRFFKDKHIQDKQNIDKIYSAMFSALKCLLIALNKCQQNFWGHAESITGINNLLIKYPLSIEQQQSVIQLIQEHKNLFKDRAIDNEDEGKKYILKEQLEMLSGFLVRWQDKLNAEGHHSVQLVDEYDSNLKVWDKVHLHWQQQHIDRAQALQALAACGLFDEEKLDDDMLTNSLENGLLNVLAVSNNLLYIHIDIWDYEDYYGYFDVFSAMLALANITIQNSEPTAEAIPLNHCPSSSVIEIEEISCFTYNNQTYQAIIYPCGTWYHCEVTFIIALLNLFLEKIQHGKRLYTVDVEGSNEVFFLASANCQAFEQLNQRLQLPFEQITWEKYGFTPEDVGQQYALINPDYQQALANGEIVIEDKQIPILKARSVVSENSMNWLLEQQPILLQTIEKQYHNLSQDAQLSEQEKAWQLWQSAVYYRNLFIALARQAIADEKVINYQYQTQPLWHLKVQQRQFDDIVGEINDIDRCLSSVYTKIQQDVLNADKLGEQVK
ncbi:MAG: hypothetical protein CR974_04465 [Gammaproteobacteria bacterium]|nr:MAG: hypothetical protein CR974_04465 [Gammaproteobacteria bacterium]